MRWQTFSELSATTHESLKRKTHINLVRVRAGCDSRGSSSIRPTQCTSAGHAGNCIRRAAAGARSFALIYIH